MNSSFTTRPLSFGLLLDSFILKNWQWLCIQKLLKEGNAKLDFIVLNKSPNKKSNKFKKYSSSKSLYYFYERFLPQLEMLQTIDLSQKLQMPEIIEVIPRHKKAAQYIMEEDLVTIASKRPDFMLRFGFGIVRGELLNIPKYGIWSFHHGDMQLLRGGPMGIWEILFDHSHQGAVLQKLTDTLDGGIVLRQGKIALSKHSAKTNINTILKVSSDWPAWVCRNILLNPESAIPQKAEVTNAAIYKIPPNNKMLRFFCKLLLSKLGFHFQQLFRAEEWNIGILEKPIEEVGNSDMDQIKWAEKPQKHTYRADPFYLPPPQHRLIFEKFDYKKQKAIIASMGLGKDSILSEEKTELALDEHLSYPFIFKEKDDLYLLPESFASNKQLVYKYGNYAWNMQASLLEDEQTVDSSILFHNGYYWLFCSKKDLLNNAGLYLYYSRELSSAFKAHPLNPIKIDINSARSAGSPYISKGRIYRPAQNCSKTYGGSLVINEITLLTTSNFQEIKHKELFPGTKGRYKQGLHTLSSAAEFSLLDGKRWIFSFPNFVFQLKRKVSKLLGR